MLLLFPKLQDPGGIIEIMPEAKQSFWKSVGDAVREYISPSKAKHRRDKPFKARQPKQKSSQHHHHRHHDKNKATAQHSPKGSIHPTQGNLVAQTDEKYAPKKSHPVIDSPEEDSFDEFGDKSSSATPNIKQTLRRFTSPEYKRTIRKDSTIMRPEEDWDERHAIDFRLEEARTRRHTEAQGLREKGWPEDAIALWVKLAMRGYEPLLPHNWLIDFETLPLELFAPKHSRAHIRALHGNDFRAIKALQSLFAVGARARDALHPNVASSPSRTPDELIRREIERYSRWAFADGAVSGDSNIPILAIVSGTESVPSERLEEKVKEHLASLRAEWRAALRNVSGEDSYSASDQLFGFPPPEVYGIVILGTMLGFVTYLDDGEEPCLQVIATFDFNVADYDVWTSLAIAILLVHCRKSMVKMKAVMGVMGVVESVEKADGDDPDA